MGDTESTQPKDIVPLDEDTLVRELWGRVLPAPIPNHELTPDVIPTRASTLDEIWRFAFTFNGYDKWGYFEVCADIANARLNFTLDELRTCLFTKWNCLTSSLTGRGEFQNCLWRVASPDAARCGSRPRTATTRPFQDSNSLPTWVSCVSRGQT